MSTMNRQLQQQPNPSSLSVAAEAAAAAVPIALQVSSLSSAESNNEVEDLLHGNHDILQRHQFDTAAPDIGILGKDFDQKKPNIDSKKFTIHQKKNREDADNSVDVGILNNKWQNNKVVARRSLPGGVQEAWEVPYMCQYEYGYGMPGWSYFSNLFNKTDGFFPKCSCPSPDTCGPDLCQCLELDADGDIFQCMDSFQQLCDGTKLLSGIPGLWSMEECMGHTRRAVEYCTLLPCFVNGGTYSECKASLDEKLSVEGTPPRYSISNEEIQSLFRECSFNSDGSKSIVQCYCDSYTFGKCVNYGVEYPNLCEAMNCCYEQSEDTEKIKCFSRFTIDFPSTFGTVYGLYENKRSVKEDCIASGQSSDKCKCDIDGLARCADFFQWAEPNCDLFQCCELQTDDNGRRG